jgi:hypothetical protein
MGTGRRKWRSERDQNRQDRDDRKAAFMVGPLALRSDDAATKSQNSPSELFSGRPRQLPTKVPTKLTAAPTVERPRSNGYSLAQFDFVEKFEPARTDANSGGL